MKNQNNSHGSSALDDSEEDEYIMSDFNKCAFEKAIINISYEITSPISKVTAYKQLLNFLIDDFDQMEADEAQNTILNAILDFKDF